MPVVVLDSNIIQVMGGHPGWVDESGDGESDPSFLRLPTWYQQEIRALSAINLALPRLNSTALVPPKEAIEELLGAKRGPPHEAVKGWGGEIAGWAERWFWQELDPEDAGMIGRHWAAAQTLDLSYLPHEGDRAVARAAYALRSCHSIVLTLDKKSFWAHRRRLARAGVVVRMPSELWAEMAAGL